MANDVDFSQMKSLERKLKVIGAKLSDYRQLWHEMAAPAIRMQRDNFRSRGSTLSAKWPPRRDGSAATLMGSGAKLLNSIKAKRFNKFSMSIGTSLDYAAPHQWGSKGSNIGARNAALKPGMPQRQFLGFGRSHSRKILDMTNAYVMRRISEALDRG